MPKSIIVEGKTTAEAIEKGIEKLNATKNMVEIKTIEDQFSGNELKLKLDEHLGKYRAMNGMLNGDVDQGELEIGQVVSLIKDIPSVDEVMKELVNDYQKTLSRLASHL